MNFKNREFIVRNGLYWPEILRKDVPKSKTALQPIFEAFTNSLEAIRDKQKEDKDHKGKILIRIYVVEGAIEETHYFKKVSIIDNGIGFKDDQFERFNIFRDVRKNYKNLGSGRIQYAHYFDKTEIESVYEFEGIFYKRVFYVSKAEDFLKHNSIVYHKECKKVEAIESETTITFNDLIENSDVYNSLNDATLKEKLLERYIHYFCYNKNNIPEINIEFYIHSNKESESHITSFDLPSIDKTKTIPLFYSRKTDLGIEKTNESEEFMIDAYKIPKDKLKENRLKLVSKGEVIEESEVSLDILANTDTIKGNKYLFLVSSNYIDSRDTNLRGVLNIPTRNSFERDLFASDKEIFLEEIKEEVNTSINSMYPEINEVTQKHQQDLSRLKNMFLLDEETAKSINISINDSESEILKKFYEAEAKKEASIDASIKESIDNLDKLDTRNPNYEEELEKEIDRIVYAIPMQNKKTLTHYVARRKLVLDLLDKILKRKLHVQQQKENYDEALIHNLIFQKGSNETDKSDLWIINEDFIYFKGSSEKQLSKLEIDGVRVFKNKFSEEEERYLTSLGENRKIKRPDVLLFPEEGKCIIIEFKAPHVNASDHLTQIDRYANLIRNYTIDQFQITTFYGYLLGESIEPRDVLGSVSRYEYSYQFDYLYRPAENVIGFDGRSNGAIYTEVIKYSTLLKRAQQRNKIFIDKLK
ncbi:ATP-binding protein [Algoriphagus formosus]|uniref:ATP-binding protein n=1 Tax=Algoriphagus formosus TaxID=2007308 RepID=UPI000C293EC1|nr:ATP-binding protein [Algoriphagus formosus]